MKVDPLGRFCICGNKWYFNKLDYIRMIIFGGITVRCPRCNRLHHYHLSYCAVEDFKPVRNENKELMERKQELWKNG